MDEFEAKLEAIKARIESMTPEEKKALALKLCGVVNETAFDMIAAHRSGASPETVMQAAANTLNRFGDREDRILN